MRLIAEEAVKRKLPPKVGRETIRILQRTHDLKPWRKKTSAWPNWMRTISSCAYNTGGGWRNIIERMHMTATLTQWYEEYGRMGSSRAARK